MFGYEKLTYWEREVDFQAIKAFLSNCTNNDAYIPIDYYDILKYTNLLDLQT